MAGLLVNQLQHSPNRVSAGSKISQPNKRNSRIALNRKRLRQFEALRSFRGGFSQDTRNYAAYLFALLLKWNGVPMAEARRKLAALAAECHPALSTSEWLASMNSAYRGELRKIRDTTIQSWLRITEQEKEFLKKCAVDGRQAAKNKPKRWECRRKKILEIVAESGKIPTCREMAILLKSAGFRIGRSQAAKDYCILGPRKARPSNDTSLG